MKELDILVMNVNMLHYQLAFSNFTKKSNIKEYDIRVLSVITRTQRHVTLNVIKKADMEGVVIAAVNVSLLHYLKLHIKSKHEKLYISL